MCHLVSMHTPSGHWEESCWLLRHKPGMQANTQGWGDRRQTDMLSPATELTYILQPAASWHCDPMTWQCVPWQTHKHANTYHLLCHLKMSSRHQPADPSQVPAYLFCSLCPLADPNTLPAFPSQPIHTLWLPHWLCFARTTPPTCVLVHLCRGRRRHAVRNRHAWQIMPPVWPMLVTLPCRHAHDGTSAGERYAPTCSCKTANPVLSRRPHCRSVTQGVHQADRVYDTDHRQGIWALCSPVRWPSCTCRSRRIDGQWLPQLAAHARMPMFYHTAVHWLVLPQHEPMNPHLTALGMKWCEGQ